MLKHLFRKKEPNPFFVEVSLDSKFDAMMKWIKFLSRKDYNKLMRAVDSGYKAYQELHGIDMDGGEGDTVEENAFMLTDEEVK